MSFFSCGNLQSVTIVQTTIDCDGDTVVSSQFTTSALFRDASGYRQGQFEQSFSSESMLWLNPEDANVLAAANELVGSYVIYQFVNSVNNRRDYYRITNVNTARRLLTSNEVSFFKCLLTKVDKPTVISPL